MLRSSHGTFHYSADLEQVATAEYTTVTKLKAAKLAQIMPRDATKALGRDDSQKVFGRPYPSSELGAGIRGNYRVS